MNEELALLKDVVSRLERAGIEYMMTGSMAMMIYSAPRMTRDIDIIIQVSQQDTGKIIALFRDDFYIDESAVRQAVRDRGMFNVIHSATVVKIDFIVRKNDPYRAEEFSRRRKADIAGIPVSVVSPEDLILSKLVWVKLSDSELQFRDVRQIMRTANGLDRAYLEKWSQILGIEDLLAKASSHE